MGAWGSSCTGAWEKDHGSGFCAGAVVWPPVERLADYFEASFLLFRRPQRVCTSSLLCQTFLVLTIPLSLFSEPRPAMKSFSVMGSRAGEPSLSPVPLRYANFIHPPASLTSIFRILVSTFENNVDCETPAYFVFKETR
jgi:hypothetical protein